MDAAGAFVGLAGAFLAGALVDVEESSVGDAVADVTFTAATGAAPGEIGASASGCLLSTGRRRGSISSVMASSSDAGKKSASRAGDSSRTSTALAAPAASGFDAAASCRQGLEAGRPISSSRRRLRMAFSAFSFAKAAWTSSMTSGGRFARTSLRGWGSTSLRMTS